jgi:AraC-like DNA-binding protein
MVQVGVVVMTKERPRPAGSPAAGLLVEDRQSPFSWVDARAPASPISAALALGLADRFGPIPEDVAQFLVRCLRSDVAVLTVGRALSDLEIPRRTLARHLERAGLSPPGSILRVLRLLRAVYLLVFELESVERAAHRAGIGRPATLRSNLQRHFKLKPRELRMGGAVGWARLLSKVPEALALR